MQIPAPGSNAQIIVSAPFGAELIKVVASSVPKGLVPNSSLSGMGAFRSIDGGVDELVRNLAIAAAPAAGTKFAQQNLVLQQELAYKLPVTQAERRLAVYKRV